MLQSMTGFGRGQSEADHLELVVEIRSLNHRYCDVRTTLPPQWARFSAALERKVRERFARGRIEVHVSVSRASEQGRPVEINEQLAASYLEAYRSIASSLRIDANIDLRMLLDSPGVIAPRSDGLAEEIPEDCLMSAMNLAMAELERMRKTEGLELSRILGERLELVRTHADAIAAHFPESIEQRKTRLEARLSELNHGVGIEPSRLAQEVVLLVDRMDVTEEIERLRTHVTHALETLGAKEPVGRKLDFLVQEMNREANTIGAKCADAVISRSAVEMKAELERLREQIQNVE